MSDSEQRQLHVPYREYQSQNNCTNAAALVETDALVDLSIGTKPSPSQILQPVSVTLSNEDTSELLPDVDFITNPGNDQIIAIDSPGIDRESQPLLGRMELDVTFNRFAGTFGDLSNNANIGTMQYRI